MPAHEYVTPTTTTSPVSGTTAGLYTFATTMSRLLVTNRCEDEVFLRFNSASAATAAATGHDVVLAAGESRVLVSGNGPSDLGCGSFSTVSVWFPTEAATTSRFTIRGL